LAAQTESTRRRCVGEGKAMPASSLENVVKRHFVKQKGDEKAKKRANPEWIASSVRIENPLPPPASPRYPLAIPLREFRR